MKQLFFFLLICNSALSQQVQIYKLSEERAVNNVSENFYCIRIYNNTNKPICIPVSNDFAYRMNVDDTLELGDIYDEKDSVITVSLFWSKNDLAIDPQQMASYPVILNPRTYLMTNIKFRKKPNIKKIFFEFKHSFGPGLDYQKITTSYNSKPKFVWRRLLKFFETNVPIDL